VKALIVEDDAKVARLLSRVLQEEGFVVDACASAADAITLGASLRYDLMVLDWMLPHISGLEVCRQLRRKSDTRDLPIIMLTARGEESDRVRGLEVGADDYVAKPFSPSELIARVRAVLRRAKPSSAHDMLTYGDLSMDLASHRVMRGGRSVHLGPTEFRLLRFLLERPGRVYSREQLLDAVWGRDIYVEPRTVDVHIRRLRKAINGEGELDLIRTVRSAGYALDETADAQ
jgi:two-component system phosphate regulon response regulator PhoB